MTHEQNPTICLANSQPWWSPCRGLLGGSMKQLTSDAQDSNTCLKRFWRFTFLSKRFYN